MHEGELCLYDMDESRHAVLDIDFHGYPVDRLGPRYGGDYMENIRGVVPHSGRWQLTEKGLQGSSEEHGTTEACTECRGGTTVGVPTSTERSTYRQVTEEVTSKLSLKGLPWWSSDQESAFQCRGCWFDPWSGH